MVLSLLYLSSARSSSSLRKPAPEGNNTQDLNRRLIDDDETDEGHGRAGGGGAYSRGGGNASHGGGRVHSNASDAEQSDADVASSPGTSFNSGTYSYTYRGTSTSVSQLANDVFFRDVHAAQQQQQQHP